MKLDEDGLALQEELKAKFLKNGHEDDDTTPEDKDKKASGQFKVGKFYIANELTSILGKDWDIVNRHQHLFILPASVTANDLLDEFQKVYRKKKIVGLGVFDQFTAGFKQALDAYIGRGLLYRFERHQLAQIMAAHPDKPLSEVYPPVVLLRYLSIRSNSTYYNPVIVKLPHQIDDVNLGKGSQLFSTTKKLIDALMKFIVDYRKDFFPATLYAPADDSYLKDAQSIM